MGSCTTITHHGEMGVGDSADAMVEIRRLFVCGFVWHSGTLMSQCVKS